MSCVTSILPPAPAASVVPVNSDDALLVFDPRTANTRYRYVVFSLSPLSVYVTVPGVAGAGAVPTCANVPPVAPSARSMLKLLSPERLWNVTTMLLVEAVGFGVACAPSTGGTVFSVGSSSLPHAATANVAIASVNAEILRPEKSIGHPGVCRVHWSLGRTAPAVAG